MNSTAPIPELSRIVDINLLEEGENIITIEASSEERVELAHRLGIQEIDRLTAQLQLDVDKKQTQIHLFGELHADITQKCVITLEPVQSQIESSFERNFNESSDFQEEPIEINLSTLAKEEPPEPIQSGKLDIGEVVAEQLALEIDPFPRAPGAKFAGFSSDSVDRTQANEAEARATGPFSALARLKRTPNTKS